MRRNNSLTTSMEASIFQPWWQSTVASPMAKPLKILLFITWMVGISSWVEWAKNRSRRSLCQSIRRAKFVNWGTTSSSTIICSVRSILLRVFESKPCSKTPLIFSMSTKRPSTSAWVYFSRLMQIKTFRFWALEPRCPHFTVSLQCASPWMVISLCLRRKVYVTYLTFTSKSFPNWCLMDQLPMLKWFALLLSIALRRRLARTTSFIQYF